MIDFSPRNKHWSSLFARKARVNTERAPPGHPIILLKSNKCNMAAVSVKRCITTSKNNFSEIYTSRPTIYKISSLFRYSLLRLYNTTIWKSRYRLRRIWLNSWFCNYLTAPAGLLLKTPRGSLKSEASLFWIAMGALLPWHQMPQLWLRWRLALMLREEWTIWQGN